MKPGKDLPEVHVYLLVSQLVATQTTETGSVSAAQRNSYLSFFECIFTNTM